MEPTTNHHRSSVENNYFDRLNIQDTSPFNLIRLNAFITCCGVSVDKKYETKLWSAISMKKFDSEWRTGHVGIPIRFGKEEGMDIRTLCSINKCKSNNKAPVSLSYEKGKWLIKIYNKPFLDIEIDPTPLSSWCHKNTTDGLPYYKVLQNDFGNLMGSIPNEKGFQECYYFSINKPCLFCSLKKKRKAVSPEEYAKIISDAANENPKITVTLTNGNAMTKNRGLELFYPFVSEIRNYNSDIPIEVEAFPPIELDLLNNLVEAGMTSFNSSLEIFDDEKRRQICPAKGKLIPKEDYIKAYNRAKELDLPTYSVLIVGLDTRESFLNGVNALSRLGVMVNPLPFKPLKGAILNNENPIDPLQYSRDSWMHSLL